MYRKNNNNTNRKLFSCLICALRFCDYHFTTYSACKHDVSPLFTPYDRCLMTPTFKNFLVYKIVFYGLL